MWALRSPRCAGAGLDAHARMPGAWRRSGPGAAAGVCGHCATDDPPDLQADVVTLRYLDVCLVLATAPFVLVAGMPVLGYAIGACAWLLTRAGTAFVQGQAQRAGDAKVKAGLQVAGMMGRIWLVALALILAKYLGGKDDGIMAAALVLGAFTVYFVMSFVTRDGPIPGRPTAQGRPSPS
jgi:hypothetical protein